jgi:hypothetical protein
MQLMFKLRVPVKPGTVVLMIECTYCGGPHPRSQCAWPLVGDQEGNGMLLGTKALTPEIGAKKTHRRGF